MKRTCVCVRPSVLLTAPQLNATHVIRAELATPSEYLTRMTVAPPVECHSSRHDVFIVFYSVRQLEMIT